MSKYGWQKSQIENSSMHDSIKDIILGELNAKPSNNDPNLKEYSKSFNEFKAFYQASINDLYKDIPDLVDIALNGYKVKDIRQCKKFIYPSIKVTPEYLLHNTEKFYQYLDDEELLNQFLKYKNNPHIFNFQKYDENNPLSQKIRGRCIISEVSTDAYLSFYIHNELKDYTSFVHETAHLIIETLYKDKINPIISDYIPEFIAYYIQLLSYEFYSRHFKDESIFYALLNNHLTDILGYMWELHIQSLIFNEKFKKPKIKSINNILKAESGIQITNEEINNFYFDPNKIICLINGFLCALDLFIQTKDDIKSGLKKYKEMLEYFSLDYQDLYSRFGINYHASPNNTLDNFKKYQNLCYQLGK